MMQPLNNYTTDARAVMANNDLINSKKTKKVPNNSYVTDKYNAFDPDDVYYQDFDAIDENVNQNEIETDNFNPYGHKNHLIENAQDETNNANEKPCENKPEGECLDQVDNSNTVDVENPEEKKVDSDNSDNESDTNKSDDNCDYVIPTPDEKAANSLYNVPPPKEIKQDKFVYTLKNGKTLVLDHPLPSCLPMEILNEEEGDSENAQEKKSKLDWLLYTCATLLPISGPIIYAFARKSRPKFAKRILRTSIASLSIIACALFILL